MILDRQTGIDMGHMVAAGPEGNNMYQAHMHTVEEKVRKTLPASAVFSIGNLSDGTGHGQITLSVQGEYVEHLAPLRERFPGLAIGPLSEAHYNMLIRHRAEQRHQEEQEARVAQVRDEVEKVCGDSVLFEIRIIAFQTSGRIGLIVFVQGEHRDKVACWLDEAFGTTDGQDIDVRPLPEDRYRDLQKVRNRDQLVA